MLRRVLTIIIIVATTYQNPVLARSFDGPGELLVECDLIQNFGDAQRGEKINIVLHERVNNSLSIILRNCNSILVHFLISGRIDENLARTFNLLRAEFDMLNSTRGSRFGNFITFQVRLNSIGGDVNSAIQIGRHLRHMSASSTLYPGDKCFSSCVFLLAGSVSRLVHGEVGIHRPYFANTPGRLSQTEMQRRVSAMNDAISTFFQQMGQPSRLFDLMRSVPPERMRILTAPELDDLMLSGSDPAHDERLTANNAWLRDISSAEMRRRMALSDVVCQTTSGMGNITSWRENFRCKEAITYGLTLELYTRRIDLARRNCMTAIADRNILDQTGQEIDRSHECLRDIMLGRGPR